MPSFRLITEGVTDQITLEIILSIFYNDTDNRKSKLINCLETLNRQLNGQEGFTIDPKNKNSKYYDRISKKFKNKRVLLKLSPQNPSFKIFINSLPVH